MSDSQPACLPFFHPESIEMASLVWIHGKRASGKTTLLRSLAISLPEVFKQKIIVHTRSPELFKDDSTTIVTDINELIKEIDTLCQRKDDKTPVCLLLDDIYDPKFLSSDCLKRLLTSQYKQNITTFITWNYIGDMRPFVRDFVTHLFIQRETAHSHVQDIYQRFKLEQLFTSVDLFSDILKRYTDNYCSLVLTRPYVGERKLYYFDPHSR